VSCTSVHMSLWVNATCGVVPLHDYCKEVTTLPPTCRTQSAFERGAFECDDGPCASDDNDVVGVAPRSVIVVDGSVVASTITTISE
jgi:hypothetical protein